MRTLCLAVALLASTALAQNCPTRSAWPTTDWTVSLVDPTAKASAIAALEQAFFTLTGADDERLGLRTDGLLIIKGGVLKYEKYARGFTATNPHISWSVAKSISSALTGVAVHEGALSLDDSICSQLIEYHNEVCLIQVRNPITFSTGLRWQEGYENESYQTSSVINMLFGDGHTDQLKFILTHDVVATPGAQWLYSTGDAELAAAVAKRALATKHGKDAFWTAFFDKVGMASAVMEEDAKGTPAGGMQAYATPRDYAKFGFLYLNDGCWNGERLLPEGWVAASTTLSDAFIVSAPASESEGSGYSWWLNKPIPQRTDSTGKVVRPARSKPWADSPDDAFAAEGHWGQFIIVIPSADVVIVRTGDDRKAHVDLNQLITLSLEVVK